MLYEQRAPLRTAPALPELLVWSRECKQSAGDETTVSRSVSHLPFHVFPGILEWKKKKKGMKNKSLSHASTNISPEKKPADPV